jgi:hypothetical protein
MMIFYVLMSERIKVLDRFYAESQEAGSGIVQLASPLRKWFSPTQAPSSTLTRWRHARVPASDFKDWLEFPAASGNLPSSYSKAAILKVERKYVDVLTDLPDVQQAVAYRLGETAVMLGYSKNSEQIFGIDPEDDNYYAVAMGIGKAGLRALPGVLLEKRTFISFPEHTVKGPVLAVPDVPSSILMR